MCVCLRAGVCVRACVCVYICMYVWCAQNYKPLGLLFVWYTRCITFINIEYTQNMNTVYNAVLEMDVCTGLCMCIV